MNTILLLTAMTCGQAPIFIDLPHVIYTRTDECVYYNGLGYTRVPVINGLVPSIRQEMDECGNRTTIYDYGKRIPFSSVRSPRNSAPSIRAQDKVKPRSSTTEDSECRKAKEDIIGLRKEISDLKRQLENSKKNVEVNGDQPKKMPRIEDDEPKTAPKTVPKASSDGMTRPSEVK